MPLSSSSAPIRHRRRAYSPPGPIPRSRPAGSGRPTETTREVSTSMSADGQRGTGRDGRSYRFDALYQDIVPNERIVYTYDMHLDDKRISVSLASIELKPAG